MKVLVFGSLNIDYVYSVDHMVTVGETLSSSALQTFCGGKGLNQAIALAKAGVDVYMAGKIGPEGDMLKELCAESGVNTEFIQQSDTRTGHTIIQVDTSGRNCILLYGGANQSITTDFVDEVLGNFGAGDYILLQNEISSIDYIINAAYEKGMKVVLNPSPFDHKITKCDLSKVSMFFLNEVEASQIAGGKEDYEKILASLVQKCPGAKFILTLGSSGSIYKDAAQEYHQDIFHVKTVDTTAAGDTYTGFFLAEYIKGTPVTECLSIASKAAAITVTRPGAAPSIPKIEEVRTFGLS